MTEAVLIVEQFKLLKEGVKGMKQIYIVQFYLESQTWAYILDPG